jgi:hypothetical protein
MESLLRLGTRMPRPKPLLFHPDRGFVHDLHVVYLDAVRLVCDPTELQHYEWHAEEVRRFAQATRSNQSHTFKPSPARIDGQRENWTKTRIKNTRARAKRRALQAARFVSPHLIARRKCATTLLEFLGNNNTLRASYIRPFAERILQYIDSARVIRGVDRHEMQAEVQGGMTWLIENTLQCMLTHWRTDAASREAHADHIIISSIGMIAACLYAAESLGWVDFRRYHGKLADAMRDAGLLASPLVKSMWLALGAVIQADEHAQVEYLYEPAHRHEIVAHAAMYHWQGADADVSTAMARQLLRPRPGLRLRNVLLAGSHEATLLMDVLRNEHASLASSCYFQANSPIHRMKSYVWMTHALIQLHLPRVMATIPEKKARELELLMRSLRNLLDARALPLHEHVARMHKGMLRRLNRRFPHASPPNAKLAPSDPGNTGPAKDKGADAS